MIKIREKQNHIWILTMRGWGGWWVLTSRTYVLCLGREDPISGQTRDMMLTMASPGNLRPRAPLDLTLREMRALSLIPIEQNPSSQKLDVLGTWAGGWHRAGTEVTAGGPWGVVWALWPPPKPRAWFPGLLTLFNPHSSQPWQLLLMCFLSLFLTHSGCFLYMESFNRCAVGPAHVFC